MQKTANTMMTLTAIGAAAAIAYGVMKPTAKRQLKRDMKETARDFGSIKHEMGNVGQDVTEMARNLRNQM